MLLVQAKSTQRVPPRVRSTSPSREAPEDRKGAGSDAEAKGTPERPLRTGLPPAKRVEFWKRYFQERDESPASVRETVQLLRFHGDMTDVEAVLGAYLFTRPERAEPWMFGTLATAIEINGGDSARVKAWLDYCARIAEKDGNPNLLILAADQLLLRGHTERVGALLDATAAKIPHRGEPLRMMLILARKTQDPDRMRLAGSKLLELGWPNVDELVRREVRHETTELAKTLRSLKRDPEADGLLRWLSEAERRDLVIRLTWSGDADLDLIVEEPLGATARIESSRTVFGGALVKDGRGKYPEAVYVCPRGFDGDYVIRVETLYNDPDQPIDRATVEAVLHEGTPRERKQSWTVTLDRPDPVVIRLEGGRRKEVLPYTPPRDEPIARTRPKVRPGPLIQPFPLRPRPLGGASTLSTTPRELR